MVQKGVSIEVSPGDLLDRISILLIKVRKIKDPDKLKNVQHQLRAYRDVRNRALDWLDLTEKEDVLFQTNLELWDIEDKLRALERDKDFGPTFVDLARKVYLTNDRRAALKREIDEYLGSFLKEEKEHVAY